MVRLPYQYRQYLTPCPGHAYPGHVCPGHACLASCVCHADMLCQLHGAILYGTTAIPVPPVSDPLAPPTPTPPTLAPATLALPTLAAYPTRPRLPTRPAHACPSHAYIIQKWANTLKWMPKFIAAASKFMYSNLFIDSMYPSFPCLGLFFAQRPRVIWVPL
jgi:hypothetical protein